MTHAGLAPTWLQVDHSPSAASLSNIAPSDTRIHRLAGGLRTLGVRPGDLVSWQLPNSTEAALLLWACWQLGATAVPLHHRASAQEVDVMLAAIPDAFSITASETQHMIRTESALLEVVPPPYGIALILHTSGSSGSPKAVIHTHDSLYFKAQSMAQVHALGAEDVVLMPAPMAHISGILNGVTLVAAAGMRSVLMNRWDPERALALISAERVSFMVGPPTFFLSLLQTSGFTSEKVRSLRLISAGGTGVSPAFCEEISQRFSAVVKRSYGSTEAPTVTTSWAGDPSECMHATDGRATPGTQLRLSETGELQLRGDGLFAGYTDATLTAQSITADDWFCTGDLAQITDGWITVTGRTSSMIIRGGENISPTQVESILTAHPDVLQAVVVGLKDARLGQRVAAALTTRNGLPFGLEDCHRWCAEQGLSRFKWPEVIHQVEAIPLLGSGKADLVAVRELLEQSSGASSQTS
ncbi:unannotated protein [freshwater metagenome]|uniref:Unannotated protein n=1 Tax=freshwater metagenome TaxID=449393 RepID=A0A6J7UHB5_9ZZZZ